MQEAHVLTPSHPRTRLWSGFLLAMVLVAIIDNVDSNALDVLLPLVRQEFHVSDFLLGLLSDAPMAVSAIISLVVAQLADRHTRMKVLAGGMLVWAVLMSLRGFVPNYLALLVVCALGGVGFAAYKPTTLSLMCDAYPPHQRGSALGWRSVAETVGALLGFAGVGALGVWLGWRWSFVTLAVPAALLSMALYRMKEPARGQFDIQPVGQLGHATLRDYWQGSRQVFSSWAMRLGTLGQMIQIFAVAGIGTWLASYLNRYYAQSVSSAGSEVALVVLGLLVGAWGGGVLSSRLRRGVGSGGYFLVAGGATLSSGISFGLALLLNIFPLFLSLCFLSGVALGATYAPFDASIADIIQPERRSLAFALRGFWVVLAGVIAGPLIGGFSDQFHSLHAALLVLALVLLVAGALMLFTTPLQQRTAERLTQPAEEDSHAR